MHPTVNPGSGDILELIRDKKVLARPGIERVDGLTVHFTDESSEDVDAIICATGALLLRCREPVVRSWTNLVSKFGKHAGVEYRAAKSQIISAGKLAHGS